MVDKAARRQRRVAAHATAEAGARQAIECGVASIEHLGELSSQTLDLAAARGVFVVPTLSAAEYRADHSGAGPGAAADRTKRRFEQMAERSARPWTLEYRSPAARTSVPTRPTAAHCPSCGS